jgi:hypothetical protein
VIPWVRLPPPQGGALRKPLIDKGDLDRLIGVWKDAAAERGRRERGLLQSARPLCTGRQVSGVGMTTGNINEERRERAMGALYQHGEIGWAKYY